MVSRMIPFRKRVIQQQQTQDSTKQSPVEFLSKLNELNSNEYLNNLKSICAQSLNSSNLNEIAHEVFQFDILLMLPGQELPMHLNVPYFWGADRQTLPQWLLVAMKRSKLFDHLFIPQVQAFTDLYVQNDLNNFDVDGNFYFYPYLPIINDNSKEKNDENVNKYVILKSKSNSIIMLDGSQVIHGVDRFKPGDFPPLFASNNHHYKIKFNKPNSQWYLYDSKGNKLKTYSKNDVRLMVVWNSHCFRNQEERVKFFDQNKNVAQLKLSDIEDAFKRELKSKNRLPTDDIAPLELWTIVIKDYLKYPVNTRNQYSTLFGFNYCLLDFYGIFKNC